MVTSVSSSGSVPGSEWQQYMQAAKKRRAGTFEDRINRGVETGDLTSDEAKTLEEQRQSLADAISAAKADGSVSEDEKLSIKAAANDLARKIKELSKNDTVDAEAKAAFEAKRQAGSKAEGREGAPPPPPPDEGGDAYGLGGTGGLSAASNAAPGVQPTASGAAADFQALFGSQGMEAMLGMAPPPPPPPGARTQSANGTDAGTQASSSATQSTVSADQAFMDFMAMMASSSASAKDGQDDFSNWMGSPSGQQGSTNNGMSLRAHMAYRFQMGNAEGTSQTAYTA